MLQEAISNKYTVKFPLIIAAIFQICVEQNAKQLNSQFPKGSNFMVEERSRTIWLLNKDTGGPVPNGREKLMDLELKTFEKSGKGFN